jgi:uncharacterized protein
MTSNAKSPWWPCCATAMILLAGCGEDLADAVNASRGGDASAATDVADASDASQVSGRDAPSAYPDAWDTTFIEGQPLPDGFEFGHQVTTLTAGSTYAMQTLALPCDVRWERDVEVTLRDGTRVYTDILRPIDQDTDLPALVAWSPYGKRLPTNSPTSVPLDWFSGVAKFEGPDAAFWVCNGYAVVNIDVRGAFKSEGKIHSFGRVDAADGYDVIEWIAEQDWSNGNVGMHGASWLAIAEWFIAAAQPPHLKAIAPWNGQSDLYRNSIALGGIPDPAFASRVGARMVSAGGVESTVAMLEKHPLINEYWEDKRARVEDITAAAYVGADVATVLHTGGTFDAFRRLGSKDKWLRVNDTNEWHDQYTQQNVEDLRRFFDHYLKGVDNGWEETPRVRVTVMDPGDGGEHKPNVPYEAWPVPEAAYQKLYLDAAEAALSTTAPAAAATATYDGASEQVSFSIRFDRETQIVGHPMARLYVSAENADDLDLFLLLEKLDADGKPLVPSELAQAYFPKPPPGVPGRQRVSLRELDAEKSSDDLPVHVFKTPNKLGEGEVVAVDIAIMPTALRWHPGQSLKLTIAGSYVKGPDLPLTTLNAGKHVVHTGAEHASYLQLPMVPWTP